MLLHPLPVKFGGNTLRFSEEALESTRSNRPPVAPVHFFMPRSAASRPRAGLGSKKSQNMSVSAATGSASSHPISNQPASTGPAKGQDDFRKMLGLG